MIKQSTYIPEPPDKFKGEQIIFSSGRVLLNAKSDSVLVFAKEAISLSSAGTLNFDSDSKCIINSPKIYLGLNAKEPLLLGNTTVDMLRELIKQLKTLTDALSKIKKQVGDTEVDYSEIGTPAQDLSKTLEILSGQLENTKSKNNFTT